MKKQYKTNDFFWDLLRKARIKENMASLILNRKDIALLNQNIALAEELVAEAIQFSEEGWEIFRLINKLESLPDNLCADSCTKSVFWKD